MPDICNSRKFGPSITVLKRNGYLSIIKVRIILFFRTSKNIKSPPIISKFSWLHKWTNSARNCCLNSFCAGPFKLITLITQMKFNIKITLFNQANIHTHCKSTPHNIPPNLPLGGFSANKIFTSTKIFKGICRKFTPNSCRNSNELQMMFFFVKPISSLPFISSSSTKLWEASSHQAPQFIHAHNMMVWKM